jgi:hypothetical protein
MTAATLSPSPSNGASAQFEAIAKLSRDLRDASKLLGRKEARYLVDLYYAVQDFRIQAAGQVRASLAQEPEDQEPNRVVGWVFESMRMLEENIKKALGTFAAEYTVGQWLQGLTGIGPVISAGFLAHLNVRGCKTAGHFWRFAGLDPTVTWEKKQKRPWNAKLKVLCYKVGESFVKVQNLDSDVYGKLFAERKRRELQANREGKFAEQATAILQGKKFRQDTDAFAWYSGSLPAAVLDDWEQLDQTRRTARMKQMMGEPGSGQPMLPPAHTHARARRYTVKLFLSHLHHVMHSDYFGIDPPMPYAFEKCPGDHRHYIAPPNWPMDGGKSLRDLLVDEA